MIYKLVTRVIQYSCFPDRPMKSGDIFDFYKGWNLRKEEGVDLEKGGMTSLLTMQKYSSRLYSLLNSYHYLMSILSLKSWKT